MIFFIWWWIDVDILPQNVTLLKVNEQFLILSHEVRNKDFKLAHSIDKIDWVKLFHDLGLTLRVQIEIALIYSRSWLILFAESILCKTQASLEEMNSKAGNFDLNARPESNIPSEHLQPCFIEDRIRIVQILSNHRGCFSHSWLITSSLCIVDILNLNFLRIVLIIWYLMFVALIFIVKPGVILTVPFIPLDNFNLIKFIDETLKHHGALKLRVQDETYEVKRAVETANVFENTNDIVHIPLVNVVFRVKF